MLFLSDILSFKTALGRLWLAATVGVKRKPFNKEVIQDADVEDLVAALLNVKEPLAPRLSGTFLVGICVIHNQKHQYLYSESINLLKKLFPSNPKPLAAKSKKGEKTHRNQREEAECLLREIDLNPADLTMEALQLPDELLALPSARQSTIGSAVPTPKNVAAEVGAFMMDDFHEDLGSQFRARVEDITLPADDHQFVDQELQFDEQPIEDFPIWNDENVPPEEQMIQSELGEVEGKPDGEESEELLTPPPVVETVIDDGPNQETVPKRDTVPRRKLNAISRLVIDHSTTLPDSHYSHLPRVKTFLPERKPFYPAVVQELLGCARAADVFATKRSTDVGPVDRPGRATESPSVVELEDIPDAVERLRGIFDTNLLPDDEMLLEAPQAADRESIIASSHRSSSIHEPNYDPMAALLDPRASVRMSNADSLLEPHSAAHSLPGFPDELIVVSATNTQQLVGNAPTQQNYTVATWQFRNLIEGHLANMKANAAPGSNPSFQFRSLCHGADSLTVARSFFQLLVLKTTGDVDIQQARPYGPILISQGSVLLSDSAPSSTVGANSATSSRKRPSSACVSEAINTGYKIQRTGQRVH